MPQGPSILEMLWEELDAQLSKLMDMPEQDRAQAAHCLGIAKCIAIMQNPYSPDVDAVRREAMERWEAKR
jgi:hypothetical protein